MSNASCKSSDRADISRTVNNAITGASAGAVVGGIGGVPGAITGAFLGAIANMALGHQAHRNSNDHNRGSNQNKSR